MGFKLRCPDCRDTFPWDPKAAWPRFCPMCKSDINNDRDDDDIVMPFVRTSAKTKSIDQFYRTEEKKSEERVNMAAEAAGCSPSEMSDLKLTNLNDRKDAEIAAIPVRNSVTEQMDHMQRLGHPAGFGNINPVGMADQVKSGPHPNAGARSLQRLQSIMGR